MLPSVQTLLSEAESSLTRGEFSNVRSVLDRLAALEGLRDSDQFAITLFEAKFRAKVGQFTEALEIVDELQSKVEEPTHSLSMAELLVVRTEIIRRLGRMDESMKISLDLEKNLQQIEVNLRGDLPSDFIRIKGELCQQQGVLYWYKGEYEQASNILHESYRLHEKIRNEQGMAASLNNLGLVHWSRGSLKDALDCYLQSLRICEDSGYQVMQANVLNNLGNVYNQMGDLDNALKYLNRSLKIKERLDNRRDAATTLLNIGVIFQLKGNLDAASEHYLKCLMLSKESGFKQDIALANSNLAEIYGLRGNLEKAREFLQSALDTYKEMELKPEIARVLANLGWVYRSMDQPERAQELFRNSLRISDEIGNETFSSAALFELVSLLADVGELDTADQYLERLEENARRSDNPTVGHQYQLAAAQILKATHKARKQVQASEMLERLLEEEISDHSLSVTAMIHLCDLLLSELRMTGDSQTFEKVKNLTDRLLEIGHTQSSYSLLAQTYLLQSKLALVDLDVESTKNLLSKARTIANEKGLHMLARAIGLEDDQLKAHLQKWESILDLNPSKREMIDLTHLTSYIERMIKRSVSELAREEAPIRKYRIVHLNLREKSGHIESSVFRAGLAQIGVSESGDLLSDFYEELSTGLFGVKSKHVDSLRKTVHQMIKQAHENGAQILFFPELTIDLNHSELANEVFRLANEYNIYVIPGSYHDAQAHDNICRVIGPTGVLWEQKKHIPAVIHYGGRRIEEGIDVRGQPREIIVASTELGRIAIAICRDFLDMDLRVELKNSDPPIDMVFNPAFTPVTADFQAAHFDARRSIYAYCFFANVAEFGDSFIHSPEKDRQEQKLHKGQEGVIYKDINLFELRSERKRWEEEQRRHRSFIQSTR